MYYVGHMNMYMIYCDTPYTSSNHLHPHHPRHNLIIIIYVICGYMLCIYIMLTNHDHYHAYTSLSVSLIHSLSLSLSLLLSHITRMDRYMTSRVNTSNKGLTKRKVWQFVVCIIIATKLPGCYGLVAKKHICIIAMTTRKPAILNWLHIISEIMYGYY